MSSIRKKIVPYLEKLLGLMIQHSYANSEKFEIIEYLCPKLKFPDRHGQFSIYLQHNIHDNTLRISWWQITSLSSMDKTKETVRKAFPGAKSISPEIVWEEIFNNPPTPLFKDFMIFHFNMCKSRQETVDFEEFSKALKDFCDDVFSF